MSEQVHSVWVTGAGGLIGHQVCQTAPRETAGAGLIALNRGTVDLTDFSAVEKLFSTHNPNVVIHCAAMSRSPSCQAAPKEARKQNVEVTRHLAELASDIPVVFLSTDLVFDGAKGGYIETDSTNPLSVYAETKLEAEEMVLRHPKNIVVRTSLNSGRSPTGNRGMDEQLVTSWRQGNTMSLFEDEFRCPIPAFATARAIWELIDAGASGIFHVAGSEKLSRWQIGELLIDKYPEFWKQISRGSLKDYNGACRSPDTSLNCAKSQALLSFRLPSFSKSLNDERISVY